MTRLEKIQEDGEKSTNKNKNPYPKRTEEWLCWQIGFFRKRNTRKCNIKCEQTE